MTQDQPDQCNRTVRITNRNFGITSMNAQKMKQNQARNVPGNSTNDNHGGQLSIAANGNSYANGTGGCGDDSDQRFNRICRDFLQGICRRKYCRYPHLIAYDQMVFCHDFQNSTCPRINCKFLHYTLDEEDYYRKYNKFPIDHMDYQFPSSNGPIDIYPEMQMNGQCRHQECQYDQGPSMPSTNCDSRMDLKWGTGTDHRQQPSISTFPPSRFNNGSGYDTIDFAESMKRPPPSMTDGYETYKRFREHSDSVANYHQTDIMAILRRFEDEHNTLRRRVETNEVKIAELRASNDYLLSQNAHIRLSNAAAQQCSRVVNPVTVTTSQPQATRFFSGSSEQQVISAVSIAPVQVQATPIVSMAGPQTQIIASTSCTPLAIAANTTQGQQLALAQQRMNTLNTTAQPLSSQIIGTSQITLTPTLAPAPSMGLAINTSQALAMSNATQPIISYPIMTHSILPH